LVSNEHGIVKIWGELVGVVAWDDGTGYATFEYDPQFKIKEWDLAPLQLPVKAPQNTFGFQALRKKKQTPLWIPASAPKGFEN
jgi:serine/threonine-protein kinase HipA